MVLAGHVCVPRAACGHRFAHGTRGARGAGRSLAIAGREFPARTIEAAARTGAQAARSVLASRAAFAPVTLPARRPAASAAITPGTAGRAVDALALAGSRRRIRGQHAERTHADDATRGGPAVSAQAQPAPATGSHSPGSRTRSPVGTVRARTTSLPLNSFCCLIALVLVARCHLVLVGFAGAAVDGEVEGGPTTGPQCCKCRHCIALCVRPLPAQQRRPRAGPAAPAGRAGIAAPWLAACCLGVPPGA